MTSEYCENWDEEVPSLETVKRYWKYELLNKRMYGGVYQAPVNEGNSQEIKRLNDFLENFNKEKPFNSETIDNRQEKNKYRQDRDNGHRQDRDNGHRQNRDNGHRQNRDNGHRQDRDNGHRQNRDNGHRQNRDNVHRQNRDNGHRQNRRRDSYTEENKDRNKSTVLENLSSSSNRVDTFNRFTATSLIKSNNKI
jgi:hypothetical protein